MPFRQFKLLDAGAGARKFRCLELEPDPEIWVPAPQPWSRPGKNISIFRLGGHRWQWRFTLLNCSNHQL